MMGRIRYQCWWGYVECRSLGKQVMIKFKEKTFMSERVKGLKLIKKGILCTLKIYSL